MVDAAYVEPEFRLEMSKSGSITRGRCKGTRVRTMRAELRRKYLARWAAERQAEELRLQREATPRRSAEECEAFSPNRQTKLTIRDLVRVPESTRQSSDLHS